MSFCPQQQINLECATVWKVKSLQFVSYFLLIILPRCLEICHREAESYCVIQKYNCTKCILVESYQTVSTLIH